ncbi:hypothetical protein [Haloarcula nitratireducens]|uniref:Transposase n=1 Tax=Haloarcula nitratireducens TaxID=2487749 RepID=A0AAW4PJJ6_9EURY|nr:hypothetical protein [Halomicroarcula nitratireducens]MBX0297922.1 hypothetical protein [Halomicroarcula nitratireducens]
MIKPLLPSIRSTGYRMQFCTFECSLLLYNLWRIVDHSLKTLVSEVYDKYGRGPHEERLNPLLTLVNLPMTAVALMLLPDGVDPPF